MKFKGDIIITDPCYIMPDPPDIEAPDPKDYYTNIEEEQEEYNKYFEDYRKYIDKLIKEDPWTNDSINLDNGCGLEKFGFTNYIWGSTIYGDWSCTTINKKDNSIFGYFCADAGLVGVFYLSEILKFNPKYDYHINKPWTTTLIKDFDGKIEYIIKNKEEVSIVGTGNVNFFTTQVIPG